MGAKLSIFSMINADLQKRIRHLARDSSKVFFTQHVQDRMLERQVTDLEILHCLQHGMIERPPEHDSANRELKCRMEHFGSSRNLAVVVALSDEDPDLLVVTVMTRTR